MGVLIFSDIHYHDHPLFLGEPGQENPFVVIAKSVFKQINNYINKDKKIDTIIFLGDLVHSRNKLNVKHINDLMDFFGSAGKNINSYILRGNPAHDGEGEHYIGNLLGYVASVIDSPVMISNYFFLPYDRKENLLKTIKEWEKVYRKDKNKKQLFMHYGLKGAKVLDYEFPDEETLSQDDLKMFDCVLAGHFHRYQEVWKNAWHVGSPYRVSFAEKDDPKGFMVLHDNGKVEFVELVVPRMVQLAVDKEDNGKTKFNIGDCFLKIFVKGTDSFIKNFDYEHYKKIYPEARGIKFETERIDDEKEVREVRINKSDNPKIMVEKYLNFVKDQTEGLDIKKLKTIAETAMGGK